MVIEYDGRCLSQSRVKTEAKTLEMVAKDLLGEGQDIFGKCQDRYPKRYIAIEEDVRRIGQAVYLPEASIKMMGWIPWRQRLGC